jgi:hypothetical protein
MPMGARFILATLGLLLINAGLRGDELDRDIKFFVNGRELPPGEPLEFPDSPLEPGVKMLATSYNIDDGQPASDTSTRNYNVICSERHAQKRKEPKQYVEFTFDINGKDERPQSPLFKTSLAHRLRWMARRATKPRPAGSEQIADKVIDALGAARNREKILGFDIDLEIEKGMVVLSGDVPSPEQRQLVGKIVRGVPEVLQVDNRLKVRESK